MGRWDYVHERLVKNPWIAKNIDEDKKTDLGEKRVLSNLSNNLDMEYKDK